MLGPSKVKEQQSYMPDSIAGFSYGVSPVLTPSPLILWLLLGASTIKSKRSTVPATVGNY
jgi:hypothetical protein